MIHPLLVMGFVACISTAAKAQAPAILHDVPADPQLNTDYIIYLHARILEEQPRQRLDARFGAYEYSQILDSFAASGAMIIAEHRPLGTDFIQFGRHVADQVRRLIAAGVAPSRIGVVGFSKGGAIAIIAAAQLAEPRVKFVLLGVCGDWLEDRNDVNVSGRILSIYEASDELGTSCRPLFARATAVGESQEIMISTGLEHGAFFKPRTEWLVPTLQWLRPR